MKTLYWVIIILSVVIVGAISTHYVLKSKKSVTEDEEIDTTVALVNGLASRM